MMPRSRATIDAARRIVTPILRAAAVAAVLGTMLAPASAQQASAPSTQTAPLLPGIEVLATPYFWLPWTSVDVRPSNGRIPGASSTIGPGTLLSNITWVPFMGQVELRSGRFGMLADYLHAPVEAGISMRNILFNGANAGLTVDTGSAVFLYRPVALPDQYLDAGIGFRAWGFDGDISLAPRARFLPPVTISHGGSWADPLIAVRYHRDFGNGYGLTGYGDVGGFGVGAHIDWQLVGTVDYAWRPGVVLHAGFRTLNFNIGTPQAGFDVRMYGPIVSATFHF